jgi:hypothetical protein
MVIMLVSPFVSESDEKVKLAPSNVFFSDTSLFPELF